MEPRGIHKHRLKPQHPVAQDSSDGRAKQGSTGTDPWRQGRQLPSQALQSCIGCSDLGAPGGSTRRCWSVETGKDSGDDVDFVSGPLSETLEDTQTTQFFFFVCASLPQRGWVAGRSLYAMRLVYAVLTPYAGLQRIDQPCGSHYEHGSRPRSQQMLGQARESIPPQCNPTDASNTKAGQCEAPTPVPPGSTQHTPRPAL